MNEWQPIETAPKDGTMVSLYGICAGEINGIAPEPTGPHTGAWCGGKSDYAGDDWWSLDEGECYAIWCKPTHWMPLPEPPK